MSWLGIALSLAAFAGVWTAYTEARNERSFAAWAIFLTSLFAAVLSPVDRFKSEQEAKRDKEILEQKIAQQNELILSQTKSVEVLLSKNAALEKQVFLLNLIKKQVSKLGLTFNVVFTVDGAYQQPTYTAIPRGNPPYVIFKNRNGLAPDIWLQSPDMSYSLGSVGIAEDRHKLTFQTDVEILGTRSPIGEPVIALKKYDRVVFYIPFILKQIDTGEIGFGKQVVVHSIDAKLVINGITVTKTIKGKNIKSTVGPGIYNGQNYWITVPVDLKTDIYRLLNLSNL